STVAGVVRAVRVQVGDAVAEGAVVVELEASAAGPAPDAGSTGDRRVSGMDAQDPAPPKPPQAPAAAPPVTPSPAMPTALPAAAPSGRKADIECDLLVLGSGPGGYTAAFRAADLGQDVVLVERYPDLG